MAVEVTTRRALRTTSPGRRAGGLPSALLAALAVVGGGLGVLAVVWLGFSAVTGAAIVVFRTGSMAPAMPQGAAAVTLPVAAAEIEPGDVVTVQRDDVSLPVTHRVLSITAPDPRSAARELVLKGDANVAADSRPYLVTEARRVVVAVPGLGRALAVAQSPLALGILTLLSGTLVVWAFWPRGGGDHAYGHDG